MNAKRAEIRLAQFSIAAAAIHFVLESIYHVVFGQFLPMLLVDYIADSLLLHASWRVLRRSSGSAVGLLCGAWGFTFCLAYLAFFWRLEDFLTQMGRRGAEPDWILGALGVALVIAVGAFCVSFYLAHDSAAQGGLAELGDPRCR